MAGIAVWQGGSGSVDDSPYQYKPSPSDRTGLNSPTSEAGATPLTAASKPAYICLISSLRRWCYW